MRNLRDAVRVLLRAPGFSLVVVLTLGLGIGASVTTFSVMYAVLWRPLPYPDAERLVLVDAVLNNRPNSGVAPPELRELAARAQTIDRVAVVSGVSANLNIDGELDHVFAASAHDDALSMFGADPPALGRLPRDREDIGPDGFVSGVAISDALWRRRFAADPSAVGRHIQVNNLNVQILGVLRPGLRVFLPPQTNAAEEIDVWFPRGTGGGLETRMAAVARLSPGVEVGSAQAELDAFATAFAADQPAAYAGGFRFVVQPLQGLLTARVETALWALGVAVAFVLLIACVNVINLLLARAKSRERELSVRHALGAGRPRLIGLLLMESALLALGGGLVGLLLGSAGVSMLDWLRPVHLPRQSQIGIDLSVAAFTLAVSAAVCIVCGLIPAFRATRAEQTDALRGGRTAISVAGVRRLQRGLVVAEIALSIVPLLAAGLMVRTFWNLAHAPLGFDPNGLLTARVQLSFRTFPSLESRWALLQNAIERVKQLPGVEGVSAATSLPYTSPNLRAFAAEDDPSRTVFASQQAIAPGYLSLTGTRLVAGRDVTSDDIRQNRLVAIIDQRIADTFWPGGAIGRRLAIRIGGKPAALEVIGVSEPVRATRVFETEVPHVFLSYNVQQSEPSLVIRTQASAADLSPHVRRVVESLGTNRPVVDIRPMKDYVDLSIGDTRFTMLMLGLFAGAALLLAGIGLYATLAYLVSQRTQELGVRMALGASGVAVLRLIAGEGIMLALIGAVLGLAASFGLAGTLRHLLHGVSPLDPATVFAVSAITALVAIGAIGLPAWRASRLDPTTALRME